MAALTGLLPQNEFGTSVSDYVTAWMSATTDQQVTGTAIDRYFQAAAGAITDTQPVAEPADAQMGVLASSPSDAFYYRFIFTPAVLELGNLSSEQTREVRVFNGWFNPVDLDNLYEAGTTGISSDITTPKTFYPLEEITYTFTIETSGPPVIDATFTFDFETGYADFILPVTGNRITIIPYWPAPGSQETLGWLTDVITAYNGSEQRIALRTSPRQHFDYDIFITANERNRFGNLLYGWNNKIFAVPVWPEVRIGGAMASGTDTLTVDTLYADFRVGGLVLLYESDRVYELIQIDSLTSTTITFDRNVALSFDAPYVMPVRTAKLSAPPQRNKNGQTAATGLAFDVIDNTTVPTTQSITTYDSLDVWLSEPLLNGRYASEQYETRFNVVDYDTGAIALFDRWEQCKITSRFKLLLDGPQELWYFREWCHRRKGKAIPFWMPSHENDLRLISTGLLGSTILIRDDYNLLLASARTHIGVKKYDGTWIFAEINAIVNTVNDDELSVSLDTALSVDRAAVESICYMGVKRFSSDEINITHLANHQAEVSLAVTEVQG